MRIDTERNRLRVGLEGPSLREVPSDDATENPLQVRFQLGLDLGPQAVEKIGDGTHDGTVGADALSTLRLNPRRYGEIPLILQEPQNKAGSRWSASGKVSTLFKVNFQSPGGRVPWRRNARSAVHDPS